MYMYNYYRNGTRLLVTKGDEGAVVGLRYLGTLNSTSLSAEDAVKFAEAVLKAAGSKAVVVPLSKDEVRVDQFGNLCCGEETSEMKVSEGIMLEELHVAVSNLATIVSFIEKNQGVEDRLKADREEVAGLLGIDMPKAGDIEGLKALDEVIKRRKGVA